MLKPVRRIVFTFFVSLLFLFFIFITFKQDVNQHVKYTSLTTIFKRIEDKEKKVSLVIGILSKLTAFSRRKAIRFTWMRRCKEISNVSCYFFTDEYANATKDVRKNVEKEERSHKDMAFMPFKGGHNFSLRLIWMLEWYLKRYNFDYFLRVDDDYFLCLERLLYELPYRQITGLYWGYLHCRNHVVRIDEGFMILTRDIVLEALSRYNSTLQCHPYGDQAVALWVQNSKINISYFADNDRVIHAATSYQGEFFAKRDICVKYIGLHGTYPNLMYQYWILSQELFNTPATYNIPDILPYKEYCNFTKQFDYRYFYPHVRFEPKLCKTNPTWSITNDKFIGRQDKGEEENY